MEADQRDAGAGRAALPKAEEELRLASAKETLPLAVKKGRGGDGSRREPKMSICCRKFSSPPVGAFLSVPRWTFRNMLVETEQTNTLRRPSCRK